MYTITILTAILAAAPMAVAQSGNVDSPNYPTGTGEGVDRTMGCVASVVNVLYPPVPMDASIDRSLRNGESSCSMTLAATRSDAYMEYASQITEWAKTIEAKAAKETNCGLEGFSAELFQCPSSHTVFFTDRNEVSSEVYPPLPFPSHAQFPIGAASPKTAVVGVGLVLSGFVAIVLAL